MSEARRVRRLLLRSLSRFIRPASHRIRNSGGGRNYNASGSGKLRLLLLLPPLIQSEHILQARTMYSCAKSFFIRSNGSLQKPSR